MVKVSFQQKPYRKMLMNTWGAQVFASPTDLTQAGRNILAEDPDSAGSLGIAISEAIERCVTLRRRQVQPGQRIESRAYAPDHYWP